MEKINSAAAIEQFLRSRGWPVTTIAPGTLRSVFRGQQGGTYPLVVQTEGPWVKFLVMPIARLPPDAVKAERLYERLLRLNGEIMLARFSLDEDGDVLLSVEFPADDLDSSEMCDALDVLTYYAERHHGEIRSLVV